MGKSTVLISGLSGVEGRIGAWVVGLYGNGLLAILFIDAERVRPREACGWCGEPGAEAMGCMGICDIIAC